MAPILIDNRGLKKLGFISVLTTVFVFAAGFFVGHQRATTFYQADSEIESLSLPEKITNVDSDIEPQAPEVIEAGEEIDVDQPETLANALVKTRLKTAQKAKDLAVIMQASDLPADVKTSVAIKSVKNTNASAENIQLVSSEVATIATQKAQPVVVTSFTSGELSKIKYSIQVGMYGRLINAENMMRKLQTQHLDAYVSDYTNDKNEVRYNVRFGYFVDKKSALTELDEYKSNQKGDGYLVKFSVENITNLAGAKNVKPSTTVEKTGKNISSTKLPSKISQDKISQADIISTSNVLTKTQLTTITN